MGDYIAEAHLCVVISIFGLLAVLAFCAILPYLIRCIKNKKKKKLEPEYFKYVLPTTDSARYIHLINHTNSYLLINVLLENSQYKVLQKYGFVAPLSEFTVHVLRCGPEEGVVPMTISYGQFANNESVDFSKLDELYGSLPDTEYFVIKLHAKKDVLDSPLIRANNNPNLIEEVLDFVTVRK